MIKEFLVKKMLGAQLVKAGISSEQQEQLMQIVTKNPELFQKIALEAKTKIDSGMDQMKAMQEVIAAHKSELEKLSLEPL